MEKLLRIFFRAGGATAARAGCPGELELAAFVDGSLSGGDCNRLQSHLADCGPCREQVAFLVQSAVREEVVVPGSLLAQGRQVAQKPPAGAGLVWTWRWGVATAAAAVLLAVVLTQDRFRETVPPIPAPQAPPAVAPAPAEPAPAPAPAESGAKTVRSVPPRVAPLRVLFPSDGAQLNRQQVVFRWTEVPGRVFFEVHVTTPEGNTVWQERIEGTSIRPPKEAFAKGGNYFVWVRAHLPGGKTIMSQVVGFRAVP